MMLSKRAKTMAIAGAVVVLLLVIIIPTTVVLVMKHKNEDNGTTQNPNMTTTTNGGDDTTHTPTPHSTTTAEDDIDKKIVADLNNVKDTLHKLQDDVNGLLTRKLNFDYFHYTLIMRSLVDRKKRTGSKIFREDVEFMQESTIPPHLIVEDPKNENIGDEEPIADDDFGAEASTTTTTTAKPTTTTTKAETTTTTTKKDTTTTETTTTEKKTTTTEKKTTTTTTEKPTTTTTTAAPTTTTKPMSDFEQVYNNIMGDVKTLEAIAKDILDGKDRTEEMEQRLKDLDKSFSDEDDQLTGGNVTLADDADKALAESLVKDLNGTIDKVKKAVDFVQDITTTTIKGDTTHPVTQTIKTTITTLETLAIQNLNSINDTFDQMRIKIDQELHPPLDALRGNRPFAALSLMGSSKRELESEPRSEFADIYDNGMDVIKDLNKTHADLDVSEGRVSYQMAATIRSAQNVSTVLNEELQKLTINVTDGSGDKQLAEDFLDALVAGQVIILESIDKIKEHKPYTPTPLTTTIQTTTTEKVTTTTMDKPTTTTTKKSFEDFGERWARVKF